MEVHETRLHRAPTDQGRRGRCTRPIPNDDDVLQGARYSAIRITTILSYNNDTNGSTHLGEKPRADQGERTGLQVGMDVAPGRYITCVLPSAVLKRFFSKRDAIYLASARPSLQRSRDHLKTDFVSRNRRGLLRRRAPVRVFRHETCSTRVYFLPASIRENFSIGDFNARANVNFFARD